MKLLKLLDSLFLRVEFFVLVVSLAAMVILSFTQVILRNVFDTGLLWADTIIRHLVLWGGFAAAAIAASEERHISIDALTRFLPNTFKHLARIVTGAFAVIACYYLGDAAWVFLLDEKLAGSEISLSIPTWIAILVIPFGYVMMAVHFLIRVLDSCMALFRGGKEGLQS